MTDERPYSDGSHASSVSRRAVLATATAGLAGFAGCSGSSGSGRASPTATATENPTATATPTPEPKAVVVTVGPGGEYVFSPGTEKPVRIAVGTTVRFVWDSGGHNVVVNSKPSGSDWAGHQQLESAGFEFSHTLQTVGEYHFYCEPHRSLGMKGTLIVE